MGMIWLGNTNGCWVEIWDRPNFDGQHRRLYGPVDLVQLRLGENGWSAQLMSLRMGPSAFGECFEDLNIPGSIFWLLPNQEVANVDLLQCSDDIDSIRLFDRPPFQQERGYPAYLRQLSQTRDATQPLRLMC